MRRVGLYDPLCCPLCAVVADEMEAGHYTGRVLIEGREPPGPWQWSKCTGTHGDEHGYHAPLTTPWEKWTAHDRCTAADAEEQQHG